MAKLGLGRYADAWDEPPGTEESPDDAEQVMYSLQHALQDFAVVMVGATLIFAVLVVTGLSGPLLAWGDAYPRLQVTELFLFAILVTAGFGLAILRRWMQLTEVARQQKETERQLQRKAAELERSNAELERFAYATSHDLREPLRMVHSYLSLLEREVDPTLLEEEAREFLDEARNASRRMDRMVQGLLEYARLDTEQEGSEPTDADAALDAALANVSMRLENQDVRIERSSLPAVRAGDQELTIIFQNLLQNALVHGGPDLSTIRIEGEVEGTGAVIRVSDDGKGIDPARQKRVFELFHQGEGSSTSAGAGMGLTLARRIVERFDGELALTDDPGPGATFEIRLAAAAPPTGDGPAGSSTDADLDPPTR